jgi:poly-gamma-glutamate synthesis protein (capsule biosynthesis protein)
MKVITFLGDISLNSPSCIDFGVNEFQNISHNSDLIVGNLEALISVGEFNLLKKPRLSTTSDSLNLLTKFNIGLVTLAHNHVYDGSLSGFNATIQKLNNLGIPYIGAGLTLEEAEKPFIYSFGTLKICFLNYCHLDTNPALPENCEVYLNVYSLDKIQNDIECFKNKCDHIVMILHWGGKYEGGYYPEMQQVKDAEFFSRLGVDLVVGHHSHTLQPNMNIGNMPVYFSLGNFIFFDVHHEDQVIRLSKRRKKGGVLNAVFSKNEFVKTRLFYCSQKMNKIQIKSNALTPFIRSFLFLNLYRTKLFWIVYNVKYKYVNPILYFVFVKEGGLKKYQKLNFSKIKRVLWKK